MEDAQLKKCTKCGEVKALEAFGKVFANCDGLNYVCKSCVNIRNKEYYANDESLRVKRKKYCLDHKTEAKAYYAVYRIKNLEKIKLREAAYIKTDHGKKTKTRSINPISRRRSAQKIRKTLADGYVKRIILASIGVRTSAIPPELIEAKREQLKLHRLLKELTK